MMMYLFEELLECNDFIDRNIESKDSIDVIIPVLNTDIFFERNLISIYRELPVNRLLIGDGGCTDNTIDVVSRFPRVKIFDHKAFNCQGASIKALVKEVETQYFAYCHADVYLPKGFYYGYSGRSLENMWIESARNLLTVNETYIEKCIKAKRSYSGVQIGDTALLKQSVDKLEDDYVQRNEDIIIRDLVEKNGGRYEKIPNLLHLHQSPIARGYGKPAYHDKDWAEKIFNMQIRGIIKYLDPPTTTDRKYLIDEVNSSIKALAKMGRLNRTSLRYWIADVNPHWNDLITMPTFFGTLALNFQEIIRRSKIAFRILKKGE